MFDYFQILIAFIAISLALYYYLTSNFDFFGKIAAWLHLNPFFGNTKDVVLKKVEISNYITELYKRYDNEAMFRLFFGESPNLVLRDLDLIKDVLIQDFSTFDERGFNISERVCIFIYIFNSTFISNIKSSKFYQFLKINCFDLIFQL